MKKCYIPPQVEIYTMAPKTMLLNGNGSSTSTGVQLLDLFYFENNGVNDGGIIDSHVDL